jgi:hypothetical protein
MRKTTATESRQGTKLAGPIWHIRFGSKPGRLGLANDSGHSMFVFIR